VRRVFSLIACVLAVLWLPATLHCGLEAAGLLNHDHESTTVDVDCADNCHKDSCAIVEDGGYKAGTRLVNIPVPDLAPIWLGAVTPIYSEAKSAPAVSPATTDSPPELVRTWQFTARTALLPGAPSVLA